MGRENRAGAETGLAPASGKEDADDALSKSVISQIQADRSVSGVCDKITPPPRIKTPTIIMITIIKAFV